MMKYFSLLFLVFLVFCGKATSKSGGVGNNDTQTIKDDKEQLIQVSTSFISFSYTVAIYSSILLSVQQYMQGNFDCTSKSLNYTYFSECDTGGFKFSGSISLVSDDLYSLVITAYVQTPNGFSEFARLRSSLNIYSNSFVVDYAQLNIEDKTATFGKFLLENVSAGQTLSLKASFKDPVVSNDGIGRQTKISMTEKSYIIFNIMQEGKFEIKSSGGFSVESWCVSQNNFSGSVQMNIVADGNNIVGNVVCPSSGEITIDDKTIKFSGNYQLDGQVLNCNSVSDLVCHFM
ncbi:MAG: hypothetical protein N2254_02155 [bacterium]|nr:hypothetical protein [bacterium]